MKSLIIKILTGTIVASSSLFLHGCSKVIDVKLATGTPQLVIDASINWEKNTSGNIQKIILSSSTGYYNAEFPTVTGATIAVRNSQNTIFNFAEVQGNPGQYICTNFVPVVGETYILTVLLNQVTYTASEKLLGTPDIDTTIKQVNEGGMTGDEIEVSYTYQDDGSQDNYYMRRVKIPKVAYPIFEMESDENYQGRKMTAYFAHDNLMIKDSINIQLFGVSKQYYDFFQKILTASGNDDSPFPVVPSAVRGNIINQTNSDKYPLGYFRLSQVSTRNYVIK